MSDRMLLYAVSEGDRHSPANVFALTDETL